MKTSIKAIFVIMSSVILCIALPATAQDKKAKEAEAKKASASAEANGDVSVIDAKAATGVEEREPTGASSSFNAGDKVTIWMAVRNPKGASNLKMVWSKDDIEVDTMDIDVGKSWRWRTWARRRVPTAGDWKVEIKDEDGNVLKTVEFKVSG